MRSSLARVHRYLLRVHRRGGPLTLLFDYDGTLAPIMAHPSLARLSPATRRLLKQLAGCPRVHVGIISGRGLADLREMVCLEGLCLSGSTGLEFDLRGVCFAHPEAGPLAQQVERLIGRFQQELADFPGAWVEAKPLGFTLHYRALPEALVKDFLARSARILAPFEGQLRAVHGPKAVEVTPELGWSKGTAVRQILDHLGVTGPGILYAGDSDNDVEAFEAVTALGGVAIGIGPEAPRIAPYRLPNPAALFRLLAHLHRSILRERVLLLLESRASWGNRSQLARGCRQPVRKVHWAR